MKFPAFLQTLLTDYFRWVAVGLVAIVLLLGYFLLLEQKINTIRTSGLLEREQVEAELEAEQKFLTELEASINTYDDTFTAQQLAEINDFLPSGPDFPGLLLTLESLARSSGLELDAMTINEVGQTISSETPTAPGGAGSTAAQAATAIGSAVNTQDITLTVSGGTSYDSFKRFITLIESSRRLLDVLSLSFAHTISADTGGEGASPYNLVVRTYYLPE